MTSDSASLFDPQATFVTEFTAAAGCRNIEILSRGTMQEPEIV